jgi:hypothetical protein
MDSNKAWNTYETKALADKASKLQDNAINATKLKFNPTIGRANNCNHISLLA